MHAELLPLVALATLACEPPAPDRPAPPEPVPSVSVEPYGNLDQVPPVCRLRIAIGRGALSPDDVVIAEGELSSYYLRRIRDHEIPSTLLARMVPHMAWLDSDQLVVAPSRALEPGATYSLAAPSGLLSTLTVSLEPAPIRARLFPPPSTPGGARHAVYCTDTALEAEIGDTPLSYQPSATRLSAHAGVDSAGTWSDRCVSLEPEAPPPPEVGLAPPLLVGGIALDPEPLAPAPGRALAKVACGDGETPLGPGCARVLDDRAVVRSVAEGALWSLTGNGFERVAVAPPDGQFLIRGLAPASSFGVSLEVHGLGGDSWLDAAKLVTAPLQSHVVLNEVMANPRGSEPAQEWVELVNDGLEATELHGFVLSDSAGSTLLPAATLAPGKFALLVREDFVADDGVDVPPRPDTLLLRVAVIGKNGLGNGGERLVLERPDGSIASVFPAIAGSKAGVSIARREPWSLDDAPDSFGKSADPGATPGGENALATP